uniref:Uncharacterized protein n=1 Tax=Lepeophtheirus salmonis TaxID=72036 RepID=A0A0K2VI07_LEPSM
MPISQDGDWSKPNVSDKFKNFEEPLFHYF